MTVTTVPIVPPCGNRLTYGVFWGTVPETNIVPLIVTPSSPLRGDGPGDGLCTVIVPHLFGLLMRFMLPGDGGDDGDDRLHMPMGGKCLKTPSSLFSATPPRQT